MDKKQVIKMENVAESVMARITALQEANALTLPKDYAVENALKSAWLILQSTEDRAHNKALEVCTKDSIANALFDMVLQGMSVAKNQGYFIVYGKRLEFQRSYFGTMALARRVGAIEKPPTAQVIYKDDNFVYTIKDGNIEVVKHEQNLSNIDNSKIVGAYAIVTLKDGTKQTTIMTWEQIQKAWGQGATKGASPAHKNFAEEMAKKSVISRACKALINSSSDAWLFEDKRDETDGSGEQVKEARDSQTAEAASKEFNEPTDAEYEEVKETPVEGKPASETASPEPEPEQGEKEELPY